MFIHIIFDSEYAAAFNKMISSSFHLEEHFFLIYGRSTMGKENNFSYANSLRINSLSDENIVRLLNASSGIIIHGLFFNGLVDFLYSNQYLLNKTGWVIWGGDLYQYREAGSKDFPLSLEVKRRAIIEKFSMIFAPEGDYELAKQVYNTRASFLPVIYPPLLDYSFLDKLRNIKKTSDEVVIQVGNSASRSNQHIEALRMLGKFKDENVRIICPLVYGDLVYREEVIECGKAIFADKFFPITGYLSPEEYSKLIAVVDIGIMNHNRQEALGNIHALLYLGKKVYIKKEVSTFQYFLDKGIKLNDIDDIYSYNFDQFCNYGKNDALNAYECISKSYSTSNMISVWQNIFSELFRKSILTRIIGQRKTSPDDLYLKSEGDMLNEVRNGSEAHFQLGEICYETGNYEAALNNYSLTFQISETRIDAAIKIVLSCLRLERKEAAVKFLAEVYKRNPGNPYLEFLSKELKAYFI